MPELELRDVTVRFGGVTALDDVSVKAQPGRITGLIGPNGAGKTTLFNVATGFLNPGRGTVRLDGRDITSLAPYKRARIGLARTFQQLELFGLLTVSENLIVAADSRSRWKRPWLPQSRKVLAGQQSEVDRLLDLLGLTQFADTRADLLSTGHARLLEVGRAMALQPRVLLLDEPASGLDDAETVILASVIRSVAEAGITVLLVEHDVGLVMRVCSEVYVLDFGRLLASGTPDQVRENPAVIEAYLGAHVV